MCSKRPLFARKKPGAGMECSYKLVPSKLTKLVGFFDYSRATLAGVCGKPSDQIRCRSQPNQLHVRSNPIPEFSGYYGGFCHYHRRALYYPDFRTWLAQANSMILPGCHDSRDGKTRWLQELTWQQIGCTTTPRASEC
jgi:hypothetical protein